ncbi:MAG: phospholipase [Pseudomonadota bacterium]
MPYDAHLHARPARTGGKLQSPVATGLMPLAEGLGRDSYLYVPAGCSSNRPCALALMLHGAGGHAHHGIKLLQHLADAANIIIVAPASKASTWDVITGGGYGPDVAAIDLALLHAFDRHAIDATHVAIGGFSDGASYALSLGISNGDLFTHIIAFSPGFIAPVSMRGKPRIFISHGIQDPVLPIDACSRKIVPRLEKLAYDVTYHEFEGAHIIPPDISDQAVRWFIA